MISASLLKMKNFFNAYDLVRVEACRYVTAALGIPLQSADFYCPAKKAPISLSLAKLRGKKREDIEKGLGFKLHSEPLFILGINAVKRFEIAGDLLLIYLSSRFYDALIRHTIDMLPEPVCVTGETRVHYALDRMRMLSRKPMADCPDDDHVQHALWLTLGIPERLSCKRLLRLRLSDASEALLTMSRHLPPAARPELLNRCGGVARCAARLLTQGLQNSVGGDDQ